MLSMHSAQYPDAVCSECISSVFSNPPSIRCSPRWIAGMNATFRFSLFFIEQPDSVWAEKLAISKFFESS